MDPFDDGRQELTGNLLSLEFGRGGRISQLWASDPALLEEGEEFQFILPPIQFGEENSDNYLPGTILLGARMNPDDPWIVSRTAGAKSREDDEEGFDPTRVAFDYEFNLLDEIEVQGQYHEVPGRLPHVAWDITLRNRSRQSIEIGELGFPMAFNTLYEGFGWTDDQLTRLWNSRVYVHKHIGGGTSWLYAQRMNASTPGLVAFPGDNTGWEFYSHVRGSLNTPYQWEGIPVVYIHSKAIVDREEWPSWANGHSSLILEPGDSRTYQMRFAPVEADSFAAPYTALQACGKPTVRIFPGCVAPTDVGTAMEISGAAPSELVLDRKAEVELDADQDDAFCFIKPKERGPLTVTFLDKQGVPCRIHLNFCEPIRDLILRRARSIADNQVLDDESSTLHRAILLTTINNPERVVDPDEYLGASGLECSLADALYLAEKNARFPEQKQIDILDRYIDEFLLDDVQNPATHAVGSVIDQSHRIGAFTGRPMVYPHVINLYASMYRVAKSVGTTRHKARWYLERSAATAEAMFAYGWRLYVRNVGVLGFPQIRDLIDLLHQERLSEVADRIETLANAKAEEIAELDTPFAGESALDTSGMADVVSAAMHAGSDDALERAIKCAFAPRSLSPSWWWYGSDKRCWDGAESSPTKALIDKGEACLAHTTIANSLIFFDLMDRDYMAIPEAYMRMAFGGMIGPWSLIDQEGGASMCYCPDLSSRQAGYSTFTGASGLGYYHYLRGSCSLVLPVRGAIYVYGCHYEEKEGCHHITPWEGVGGKIVIRQHGLGFTSTFGTIRSVVFDGRKRWVECEIVNLSDMDGKSEIKIEGLWGEAVSINGKRVAAPNGIARTTINVPAEGTVTVKGKVSK